MVNHKLLEVQNSAREKEITAWLAPAAYDVNYYRNDLANARALRHPKTCQWIFEKEEMDHLLGHTPNGPGNRAHEESFLWIYAKPVCIMQNHRPPERRQTFDLRRKNCMPFCPLRKSHICLETLISSTQHNANSKISAGSREDYLVFTLD